MEQELIVQEAAPSVCTACRKALPIALPLLTVAGLGFLVYKIVKRRKARSIGVEASEVNPE